MKKDKTIKMVRLKLNGYIFLFFCVQLVFTE